MIEAGTGPDDGLSSELARIARQRIYFGHQSVGANVLDGVAELARKGGVALRIAPFAEHREIDAGTFAHGPVGTNGSPRAKLDDFAQKLRDLGAGVDIALVKFCYADIGPATDVHTLFAHYRKAMEELRGARPATTFVHVTVPLVALGHGWKGVAKRLLGRPQGTADNARREDYNALLREAYEGREPLFDLARVEARGPHGEPEATVWKGRTVPVLVPGYTDDGGHLNRSGRERTARALVAVLASITTTAASSPAA